MAFARLFNGASIPAVTDSKTPLDNLNELTRKYLYPTFQDTVAAAIKADTSITIINSSGGIYQSVKLNPNDVSNKEYASRPVSIPGNQLKVNKKSSPEEMAQLQHAVLLTSRGHHFAPGLSFINKAVLEALFEEYVKESMRDFEFTRETQDLAVIRKFHADLDEYNNAQNKTEIRERNYPVLIKMIEFYYLSKIGLTKDSMLAHFNSNQAMQSTRQAKAHKANPVITLPATTRTAQTVTPAESSVDDIAAPDPSADNATEAKSLTTTKTTSRDTRGQEVKQISPTKQSFFAKFMKFIASIDGTQVRARVNPSNSSQTPALTASLDGTHVRTRVVNPSNNSRTPAPTMDALLIRYFGKTCTGTVQTAGGEAKTYLEKLRQNRGCWNRIFGSETSRSRFITNVENTIKAAIGEVKHNNLLSKETLDKMIDLFDQKWDYTPGRDVSASLFVLINRIEKDFYDLPVVQTALRAAKETEKGLRTKPFCPGNGSE